MQADGKDWSLLSLLDKLGEYERILPTFSISQPPHTHTIDSLIMNILRLLALNGAT